MIITDEAVSPVYDEAGAAITDEGTGSTGAVASASLSVTVVPLVTPVPSRPGWHFIIAAPMPAGTLLTELPQPVSRQLTVYADSTQTDQAIITVDGEDLETIQVQELASDIIVIRDGTKVPLFRGRVMPTQDTFQTGNLDHEFQVTANDYRTVLSRQRLQSGDTLSFTNVEQASIAWQLIQAVQSHTGGTLGITRGVGQNTGIQRTAVYGNQQFAGDLITQMSQLDKGFDWAISPYGIADLRLDIWAPFRGRNNGVVLELGGGLIAPGMTRLFDPSAYLNAALVSGTPPSFPSLAFTASSASPCVFTLTGGGSPYHAGDAVGLSSSSGSLPGGFAGNVNYWVTADMTGATFKVAASPGGPALASTSTGSGNVQQILVAQAVENPSIATLPQGRWDQVIGTSIQTQSYLNSQAAWYEAQGEVIMPTYTVPLQPGAWQGPGHIWAGDTVRMRISSGRLQVDSDLRVQQIDIVIDSSENENVTLTIGQVPLRIGKAIQGILRRLRALEAGS